MMRSRLLQRLVCSFTVLAAGLVATVARAMPEPRPEGTFGLPRDASVDGNRVDWLLHSTSIFVIILFVIMVCWMVYAALKHGTQHRAEYDHGSSTHSVTVALVVSALIFFVVDGNLFYHAT